MVPGCEYTPAVLLTSDDYSDDDEVLSRRHRIHLRARPFHLGIQDLKSQAVFYTAICRHR